MHDYDVLQAELRKWLDDQLDSVKKRCVTDPGGCLIWSGAKSHKRQEPYGQKKVSIPILHIYSKVMYVHRLVYMATHHDMTILEKNGAEVSHLCHKTLCCNPKHLVLESNEVNSERRTCRLLGHCT